MEYGSLTLALLLKHLSTELNLCTNQTPTIWFYDKRLNKDTRLADEIQMIDLFEMYKEEMTCQVVVGVFDRSTCLDHEFDELEPICVIPPAPVDAPDDAADLGSHDDNIPNEPTRGPSQPKASPSVAQENPEAECDIEPDIFDNAEEYVEIDDEALYAENPQAPEFAQPQPFDNANSNVTADPDVDFVHVEAEVDDADPLEVNILHDPENPKIVKGELFPDVIAFRKAIRYYAVKTGFEFAKAGYKTDKTRFIAKCTAEGCPWPIHAFTIFDKKTVEVYHCILWYISIFYHGLT